MGDEREEYSQKIDKEDTSVDRQINGDDREYEMDARYGE
jgi:hypothetical protein